MENHMKFLILISLLLAVRLWGCTDLVITTQDGALINGRSMEFALPMKSRISFNPRGMVHLSKGQLSWTSKYGYVSIDCLDQGLTTDGMNEQGLSVGALWFPGAQYPQDPKNSSVLVLQDVGPWLLGNFATVEEVKEGLSKVTIWAEASPPIGIPPIHFAVHDAKGNHLVVEFIDGKMEIHDNPNGVLTNAPKIEWHLTNLRNYINLSAINAGPVNLNGSVLQPTGQGTGLLGIPGDWTPPSRFVRASLFKAFAVPPMTAPAGINLVEHLLNTVDIPFGIVRGSSTPSSFELTQWVVIKDLKNKILYYRTYEDLTLRFIDLKKLDFSAGRRPSSFPMQTPVQPVDMTSKLD